MLTRILAILIFALTACSFSGTNASENQPACPEPSGGVALLKNDGHGYCLLYPDTYEPVYPNDDETVLVVGSLLNVEEPRVIITVEDAGSQTVGQTADSLLAEFPAEFNLVKTPLQIGGEEAYMLDNLPGQDFNRQVVVVHNNRLYRFMFAPVGKDYGDVAARTETLYTTVIDSMKFLP